ncbi:stage II sporulation protein AB (anti-sigma F factor) [Salsuginibacillus halophilus]|uniref:Anti-sigma F factor n=1 Tax=Salsuginibacillus halophilus TaxID=517424 RepID=A0A2P8HAU6_9BACI|nr:anti-sigma F factor [Salsuginibacillus halophilus]PSL43301.1 stage II sporulation protein AB (anti-sigma F factor) [Salsuginibacillus halophilus]
MTNEMSITFSAVSENEAFARVSVGAFVSQLDPTMDEVTEIKTVISESVTNAIIHGYNENPAGNITISAWLEDGLVTLTITDEGKGMQNVDEAREPLFTSRPELERSGMGFTIMENFMDEVAVHSVPEKGTTIYMKKHVAKSKAHCS